MSPFLESSVFSGTDNPNLLRKEVIPTFKGQNVIIISKMARQKIDHPSATYNSKGF